MLVLVFHPRLAREILVKGMALLEKLHFLHHKEARIEKLNASMDQYRDTAVFLKEHKQVIVNCICDHHVPAVCAVYSYMVCI